MTTLVKAAVVDLNIGAYPPRKVVLDFDDDSRVEMREDQYDALVVHGTTKTSTTYGILTPLGQPVKRAAHGGPIFESLSSDPGSDWTTTMRADAENQLRKLNIRLERIVGTDTEQFTLRRRVSSQTTGNWEPL